MANASQWARALQKAHPSDKRWTIDHDGRERVEREGRLRMPSGVSEGVAGPITSRS